MDAITGTISGYDCLIVPNAVKAAANTQILGNHFCGRYLGTAENAATGGKTVCSMSFIFLQ